VVEVVEVVHRQKKVVQVEVVVVLEQEVLL